MGYSAVYHSPIGPLLLTSDKEYLTGLQFCSLNPPAKTEKLPIFTVTMRWLDAYFAGTPLPAAALPLSPVGTEFQRLVWEILLAIPFGQTRTYGEIAKEVACRMNKDKMSAQAVGGAVGRNPISIIIPCHRVIGANGTLTGYAGGLDKKEWLLRHEEVIK